MNYCAHCGNEMSAHDRFCSKCGRAAVTHHAQQSGPINPAVKTEKEPLNKLACELAYTGTLFWLPLLLCPKEENARYHANQGLWVLILSTIACSLIRGLGMLSQGLSGSIIGIFAGGLYSLVFIAFLVVMLYLLWNVIQSAMRIHREKEPVSILFFQRCSIIK